MNRQEFRGRSIFLSPFGLYTRHVLISHLRNAFVICLALLCIALSVDMPSQIEMVLADVPAAGTAVARLGWFALLRGIDLLPRFIPLATFLAVVWTEISLTLSRERILVWNTGRSLVQCMMPAFLLMIILGTIQFACDAYLRPAAMNIQITEKLGNLGEQFNRGLSQEAYWVSFGNDLVHTHLEFGPPPVMRDLTLYGMNSEGRLSEVYKASSAMPALQKGNWILRQGSYWVIPPENDGGPASVAAFTRTDQADAIAFDQLEISLAADPFWLSNWRIEPQYLPHNTLRTLTLSASPDNPHLSYVNRYYYTYANALLPGAMAVFAEALCLLIFAYAAPIQIQLSTLGIGYAAHLSMKTFTLMGEHDYIDAAAAPMFTPLALFLLAGLLLGGAELRRRSGGKLSWTRMKRSLRAHP